MFNKRFVSCFLALGFAVFVGCDSNPTSKLLNPVVTTNTVSWPNNYVIYQNQIMAGVGIQFFTTQNGQFLDFNSTESVAPGSVRSIKYSWDGSQVTPYNADGSLGTPTYAWAGFGLQVLDPKGNPTTKNITPGSYTKISFQIKGSLSSNVALRMELKQSTGSNQFDVYWQSQSNSGGSPITNSWQTYYLDLQGNGLNATSLQYYLIITFQNFNSDNVNTRSNGGTVYLDNIQFTK